MKTTVVPAHLMSHTDWCELVRMKSVLGSPEPISTTEQRILWSTLHDMLVRTPVTYLRVNEPDGDDVPAEVAADPEPVSGIPEIDEFNRVHSTFSTLTRLNNVDRGEWVRFITKQIMHGRSTYRDGFVMYRDSENRIIGATYRGPYRSNDTDIQYYLRRNLIPLFQTGV